MNAKKKPSTSAPFNLALGTADRERVAHLAEAWGTTLSEAIRRSVESTYERHVQGLMGTKLDALVEKTGIVAERSMEILTELGSVKTRVGNAIEVTRGVEIVLKGIAGEARSNSATAALLLRAMINTLKSRPEIEAEVTRLLQEAQHGHLPEA